jgi:restriction system protein
MAVRGAAGGYFVTSGVFTEEAVKFTRGLNLELIDGVKLRQMIDAARKAPVKEILPRKEPVQQSALQPSFAAASPAIPDCPRCGAAMVKRIAKEGVLAGKQFWGCSTFPKCHGTRDIEEKASDWVIVGSGHGESGAPAPLSKICPECSTDMSLRQFQTGNKAGQYFYGCTGCKKGWPVNSSVSA